MTRKTIPDIIAILFILLFVYAGTSKLIDYERFRWTIRMSPLLRPIASWIAWMVPAGEIAIALLFLSARRRILAFSASLASMLVFLGYVIVVSRYSSHIPCTCGGFLQQMSWNTHILFNTLFAGLAWIGLRLEKKIRREGIRSRLPSPLYT
jgi:uncharacterized membrane protein YphA (DoxX/SURF4 family)